MFRPGFEKDSCAALLVVEASEELSSVQFPQGMPLAALKLFRTSA
jgi:hypothetical protein